MTWYWWVIAIFFFDILGGFAVWWVVDDFSSILLDEKEAVAVLIFWPILGLILGIMGIMSIVIKTYKKLEEDMEEK